MPKWVKKWRVEGSNGNIYTVALSETGEYGCSCPAWKFRRIHCKHIQYIEKHQPEAGWIEPIKVKKPPYRFYNIPHPYYDKKEGIIKLPLVPLDPSGLNLEVEICVCLMENGYSWGDVKDFRHIPNQWTRKAVYSHYNQYIRRRNEATTSTSEGR